MLAARMFTIISDLFVLMVLVSGFLNIMKNHSFLDPERNRRLVFTHQHFVRLIFFRLDVSRSSAEALLLLQTLLRLFLAISF